MSNGAELTEASGAAPIYRSDGSRLDGSISSAQIERYNFRSPGFLSQADLRQLEIMHEKFARHLSGRLSTFLRMECVVKMLDFTSSNFSQFAESLQEPTHVTVFQIESLRGVGILEFSLPLSLAIADRVLGGKGKKSDTSRCLTEIEIALLEDVIQLTLVEWIHQWPEQKTLLNPNVIGHESSGRFLQTAEPEAPHVVLRADVACGDCVGRLQMGVPFSMIEPIVKSMAASRVKGVDVKAGKVAWRAPFNSIDVPVIAEWFVKEMTVAEVIELRPGDLLELSRDMISQTQVRLSNTAEFTGTAGVENGRIAVQLTKRRLLE